ncbi:phlebovirus glycoprotein G1 [Cooperia oncophora]
MRCGIGGRIALEKYAQERNPAKRLVKSTHGMVTKIKSEAQLFAHYSLLSRCSASDSVTSNRCPSTVSLERIIYADQCVEKGIAVAAIVDNVNSQQRFVHQDTSIYQFPCLQTPDIAEASVSARNGQKLAHSTMDEIRKHHKPSTFPRRSSNYKPPHVCSFHGSSMCSSSKKVGIFYQVELYDGTTIIVPELRITTRQFFNKEDYYCFDYDGKLIPSPVSIKASKSGSPAFCRYHTCSQPTAGSVFCTYYTPITTLEYANSSIVIRAWGTVPKEYFSHRSTESSKETTRSLGGITVETINTLDVLESCSTSTCIFVNNYQSNQPILFPTSIVMFEYEVSINGWLNGERILSSTLKCPGQPLCETLNCKICWEKIYNFQCWTTTEIATSGILIIAVVLLLHIFTPLFTLLYRIGRKSLYLPLVAVKTTVTIYKRFSGRNQSYPIERSPYQLRRRRRRPYGIVATIVCLVSTVRCCSDIEKHHTAQSPKTKRNAYTDKLPSCSFNRSGQEACLLLKNKENRIMATVSIRLKQISHICKQKPNISQEITSSSRNPDISAITLKAAEVTPALPTSSTIYRVFSCPTWSIQAEGTVTLRTESSTTAQHFTLQPGIPFTWNNLRLTFAGTILPNLPILSSYFITDGNIVTRIEPSQQGQLLPNSAGQLQCRTEEEAKSFGSCIFAQYACSCNPRKYAVTCSCPNGTTSSFLHNKHNKLPVITGQAALINERQTIKAKTTIDSALTIQISTNELVIAASINNNSCQVHMEELTGCYSCTQGAIANVSCRSSISEETAQIECSDTTRIVRCTPEGEISTVRFHFINSMVNENCTVRCPGGISTVILKGQLAFVNEATFITEMITPRRSFKSSSSGFTFENVSNFFSDIFAKIPGLFGFFSNFKIVWTSICLFFLILCFLAIYKKYKQLTSHSELPSKVVRKKKTK